MKPLSARQRQWLASALSEWTGQGLIAPTQAEAIRARHLAGPEAPGWGRLVFSSIGAVLLGLGVILIFAFNWEKMPHYAKLAAIFAGLATAHGLGRMVHRPAGAGLAAAEGLHLLGTMLFGAGIWLVAQIYHIDAHYPNAFLAWGLGALALSWALPSIPQGILAAILLTTWTGVESVDFRYVNHMAAPLVLAGTLPLAWLLRSRTLGFVGGLAGLTALAFTCGRLNGELVAGVLFLSGCGLLALGPMAGDEAGEGFRSLAAPLSALGWILHMGLLYAFTFPDAEDVVEISINGTADGIYFWLFALWALGLCTLGGLAARRRDGEAEPDAGPDAKPDAGPEVGPDPAGFWSVALAGAAAAWFLIRGQALAGIDDWAGAAPFNLLFLAQAGLLIVRGGRESRMIKTAAGCLLVAALAGARYVDLFDSLLLRGIVFFLTGGAIFWAGNRHARSGKERS